jgi:recombinational DNA repair protein RecR
MTPGRRPVRRARSAGAVRPAVRPRSAGPGVAQPPGVGPKAAQRIALHLLQHDRDGAARLANALQHAVATVRNCERCNTFTEDAVCALCRSAAARSVAAVRRGNAGRSLMVEQTQAYSGLYYVLMGRLSPLDGIGPKEIRLERLIKRATDGVVRRRCWPRTSPTKARRPPITSARC